jgi:hypothetical protein
LRDKRIGQNICGCDCVLNCQIDAHPPIGDIACAASPMHNNPVDTISSADRCERSTADWVPIGQFIRAVGDKRRDRNDIVAKLFKTARLDVFELAFANQVTALPVVAAIQHDHHLAIDNAAKCLLAV